jgi:hypothetical protein
MRLMPAILTPAATRAVMLQAGEVIGAIAAGATVATRRGEQYVAFAEPK